MLPLTGKKSLKILGDPSFSEKFQERVSLFAKEYEKLSLTPSFLTTTLKEAFPAIDTVSVTSFHDGRVAVFLTAHTPLMCINKTHLFFKKGGVGDVGDFKQEIIHTLPTIMVAKKDEVPVYVSKKFEQWARAAQPFLFSNHDVMWSDESYIIFKDKKDPAISLIGSASLDLTQELFDACEGVKKKIIEKQEKHRGIWFIDMRFKNQIVAFRQTRGKV